MKNYLRDFLNEFKTFIFLISAGRLFHNFTFNSVILMYMYVFMYLHRFRKLGDVCRASPASSI